MEGFMWELARALAVEPDLDPRICLKRTRQYDERPELAEAVETAPAPTVMVDRGSRALWREIKRADLVHAHTYSPDVALIARLLRRPFVLTVHNRRRGDEGLRGIVGRWAAGDAAARWYNSDFVWDSWEPEGRRATSEKLPVVAALPDQHTAPEERAGFVFAGRWIENKGLEPLIEAYAGARIDHAAWPLVLLGDGPLRPKVEALVAATGLASIRMPGFVDVEERDRFISRARWLVAPPHTNEDLGLTPIEARAAGVPCIVTRDGGLPEAAGPFSLVCEPGDVDDLRRALESGAGMDEAEYARLARGTKDLLDAELGDLTVYADRYRRILERSYG